MLWHLKTALLGQMKALAWKSLSITCNSGSTVDPTGLIHLESK